MLDTAARRRLLALLTHPESADLNDLPLARMAGVTIRDAREYREEFDSVMRYAVKELRHISGESTLCLVPTILPISAAPEPGLQRESQRRTRARGNSC